MGENAMRFCQSASQSVNQGHCVPIEKKLTPAIRTHLWHRASKNTDGSTHVQKKWASLLSLFFQPTYLSNTSFSGSRLFFSYGTFPARTRLFFIISRSNKLNRAVPQDCTTFDCSPRPISSAFTTRLLQLLQLLLLLHVLCGSWTS